MAEDGYSLECNESVKQELKKAHRRALYWVIAMLVFAAAIRLSHSLLDVPANINRLEEAIGGFCAIMAAYWYFLHGPLFSVIAVTVEFRLRSIEMRERLEAIETQIALER
jgi:chromate transport protein ChrA